MKYTLSLLLCLAAGCGACGGQAIVVEDHGVVQSAHGILVYKDKYDVSMRDFDITVYVTIAELQQHALFTGMGEAMIQSLKDWDVVVLFEDTVFKCPKAKDAIMDYENCFGLIEIESSAKVAIITLAYDPCIASTSLSHELTHFFLYATLNMRGEHESMCEYFNCADSASEVAKVKAIIETECE